MDEKAGNNEMKSASISSADPDNIEAGKIEPSRTSEVDEVEASRGWFGALVRKTQCLPIEERGIEPVRPEDRDAKQSVFDGFTMWASANLTPATFATGTLGHSMGLGFWDSFAAIVITNAILACAVAWVGCLGPKTGMRMMTIGRYSLGIWGSRLVICLNVCGLIGWAAINGLSGAQVLTEVSNGKCPLWAGNLIIHVVTACIAIMGYRAVHMFERYCWIPQLFAFCFIAGYGAKHFDASAAPMGSGQVEAANVLTFMGTLYSFLIGWAASAADYYVRQPVNTNKVKLAGSIWAGNFLGASITEILGAAFMTAVNKEPAFAEAYSKNQVGGVMGQALLPIHGFGKFLLVLLALSVIACNLVNLYSIAFICQNFHPVMVKVPRFVWSFAASGVAIGLAIGSENSFNEVLQSIMDVIGYYGTAIVLCMALEHYIFRKGSYPLDDWNDMHKLPWGIAGFFAIGMAFVGAVLTMDQQWYTGVISKAIKPAHPDLGWLFAGIFTFITFLPLRWLERRIFGR